jgi:hypothetical protein
MIECIFDVIDLSIFVMYNVQYVATTYGSKDKLNIYIYKTQMNSTCTKCISFFVSRSLFKKHVCLS